MVQGTAKDRASVCLGIPFATPPVGDLRWQAPHPAAPWQGVRQADKFSPRNRDARIAPEQVSVSATSRLSLRKPKA
jgi:carboxylesterase type B